MFKFVRARWMRVVRCITAACLAGVTGTAMAQAGYPAKPIRLIIPYAPGSTTGAVGRPVAQKIAESMGQQWIVDERGGGNTVIGSEALVRSAPDGYTLLMVSTTHAIIPLLMKLPYDVTKDFTPIARIANSELALVINPSVPANTLQEFIALAKSKPGQLNYATGGAGTTIHLATEAFNLATGVRIQHVAYKGAGPAMTDLIGGQVQMYLGAPISVAPHVGNGKLRALAVTGDARSTSLPQIPTFREAGVSGVESGLWFGILAPANTPRPVVDRLNAEFRKALAAPDVKASLSAQGADPAISTPDEFAALVQSEMTKYARIIKAANVRID